MITVKYEENGVLKGIDAKKIQSINFNFILNGYGKGYIEMPLKCPEAKALCEARVYVELTIGNCFFAGMTINKDYSMGVSEANPTVKIELSNIMRELNEQVVTTPNEPYIDELVANLVDPNYANSFVEANTAWTSTLLNPTTQRITYLSSHETSLHRMKKLTELTDPDLNFRYAGTPANPRHIEWGFFENVLTNINLVQQPSSRDKCLKEGEIIIEEVGINQTSENLTTVLYVLGGGGNDGLNQITCRDVDPAEVDSNYPVLIDTRQPNTNVAPRYDALLFDEVKQGANNYVAFRVVCPAGQAKYKDIIKPIQFKEIQEISSQIEEFTDQDRIWSANMMYRMARNYLAKHCEVMKSYTLSLMGDCCDVTIGDILPVKYSGYCSQDCETGKVKIYEDIDEQLYVMEKQVSYENGVIRSTLIVNSLKRVEDDDTSQIGRLMESVEQYEKQKTGSTSHYYVQHRDSFDSQHPATFLMEVPKNTIRWNYMDLRVRIRPFRSYTQSNISSGGANVITVTDPAGGFIINRPNHGHTIPVIRVTPPPPDGVNIFFSNTLGSLYYTAPVGGNFLINTSFNNAWQQIVGNHVHGVNIVIPAGGGGSVNFGIYEDPNLADDIQILIDGVDYTNEITGGAGFGAFGYYPVQTTRMFDVIQSAKAKGGTVYDDLTETLTHEVEVRCSSGLAHVELMFYYQFYISSQ